MEIFWSKDFYSRMNPNNIFQSVFDWMENRRNLKILREKLDGLVFPSSLQNTEEWKEGLTESVWKSLIHHGKAAQKDEIRGRTYLGGVEHSIRKEVWPYLLEHFKLGSSIKDKEEIELRNKQEYARLKSEWKPVELSCREEEESLKNNFIINSVVDPTQGQDLPDGGGSTIIGAFRYMKTCLTSEESVFEKAKSFISSTPEDAREDSSWEINHLTVDEESSCISTASSGEEMYSADLLQSFETSLHGIDSDILRCDRNVPYFSHDHNLKKLRNVVITYVWKHLDTGYVQGMCDLASPLLAVFDDEALTYSCFLRLMERMSVNFTNSESLNQHYDRVRSLIQIFDSEMFSLMQQDEDYTCFCYRWFLLDLKRELDFEEVLSVWEVIWAARYVSSSHFVVFFAFALVQHYRDLIIKREMKFSDISMFFNALAEKHDGKSVLEMARNYVTKLQIMLA